MNQEQLASIAQSKKFLVAATAAFAGLAGAVAGFKVAQKQLEKTYADLATAEIEQAKIFYSTLHKKDDYETPESTAETLGVVLSPEADAELREAAEVLKAYQGEPNEMPPIHEARLVAATLGPNGMGSVDVVESVFDNDADYDLDDEDDHLYNGDNVDLSKPVIISKDAFFQNEPEYTQVTVTYFQGDDIVVDERDDTLDDVDDAIGNENLQRFGQKSKDPNVVYVRNHKRSMDFEVLKSKGKFEQEVLGYIEHSDKRGKIRKFRGDDE